MRIGFIGAGNMAQALAASMESAFDSISFIAYDIDTDRLRSFLGARRNAEAAGSNWEVSEKANATFLAVKPQVLGEVLPELGSSNRLFVSILAGVRLARLEEAMPEARVIRVMPNTPCLVGAMAAGFTRGLRASEEDRALVASLLQSAGVALELDEGLLDAVTGLSGSGPAFVARLIEAFAEAGVAEGLSEAVSYELALATFGGTARLLSEKAMKPDELVAMVSSPGGTTLAGRSVLEDSNMKEIIARTVSAASYRSRELGR